MARPSNRFVLQRLLGEGGMGLVFEAFDEERRETVALKTLERMDARAIYRLKQEFRALVDLVHPSLVRIYELFSEDGRWFFTMQKIDGVTFLEHVRSDVSTSMAVTEPANDDELTHQQASCPRQVGLMEDKLRAVLPQLVDGVRAIHRAGKLHCDLKPSNVLVAGGRVAILDFGLVRSAEPDANLSSSLETAGTPAYMAPEQLGRDGACAASDWYALGVMLYEALTGVLPFDGNMYEMLVAKLCGQIPLHPRKHSDAVPDDLAELAMALLEPDPQKRPREADIMEIVGEPETALSAKIAPGGEATEFVGREGELGVLRDAYQVSRSGIPAVVCVEGATGTGKSTLVERFLSQITGGEPLVLRGRCYEREIVPFRAIDAVVDELSRILRGMGRIEAAKLTPRHVGELCHVFPVLARLPVFASESAAAGIEPTETRRRAFAALKELFRRIVDRRPVVVAIDDLQWGDADSAALLAYLLEPPEPPAILWILSYRSDQAQAECRILNHRNYTGVCHVLRIHKSTARFTACGSPRHPSKSLDYLCLELR